ncbi:hypothetical protein chiPu_0020925 [Chiloscyllium punctatum]|uniref:KASH domain-containing protein n=1 Tax=Chiloscyllium punctatum TaxID=137246 RepID=A0A401RL91_CHIPU|nr:hypothetical protein [Chiloscyllium punctatum]
MPKVKKLKDTLCSEQLLDREMSNLRTWLSRIESELSKPVIYNICDDQEIEKKLAEQQELQRDIEQHSVGVTSVLNLCDSLLLDTDTESECDSIQQTTRSLDRRWRNICAMSVERRMKIEETWRLWQKFLEDYSRFDDWLKGAERTAAHPNSSQVPYSLAKEELKKFETFQRQIHESLTQLELINKQYRRLARENRTDSSSRLKQMVHEGNQRWDSLQKRIAAILRRLKHFISQREEFESCRECILVWLTEMDLQLTNVEHFSESDIDDKVRQLNVSTARFGEAFPPCAAHMLPVSFLQEEISSKGVGWSSLPYLFVFRSPSRGLNPPFRLTFPLQCCGTTTLSEVSAFS